MAAGLALLLSKHFQVERLAKTAIALVLAAPAAYLSWATYRSERAEAEAGVGALAARLAGVVAAAEAGQRAQLLGPGTHRIDLAFTHRREPANNAAGAAPEGHLAGIVGYYRQLRPARLVITGQPGAGKTLLALDLLLGLLTHPGRSNTDPVPVRFSLAGWDTGRPLRDWLAEQVHDQFRDRGITAADARQLVEEHKILPVLDGLDEMDTPTTPLGQRRATRALAQLNTYQDPTGSAPVILTCRTAQYTDLAAVDLRMREAARVEIQPVTPGQATTYLTARCTNPHRWAPVLEALTTTPGCVLTDALSTPWRLNLAVTAYEERDPDTHAYLRDPGRLLVLTSPESVRDHLLALYLPAAISQHPTRPHRYRPERTHHWLAALATHLATTSRGTVSATDLVLHELWPMAGTRRVRTADVFSAALLSLTFAAVLPPLLAGPSPIPWPAVIVAGCIALWFTWQAGRSRVSAPAKPRIPRLRSRAAWQGLAASVAFGLVFTFVAQQVAELWGWPGALAIGAAVVITGRITSDWSKAVHYGFGLGLAAWTVGIFSAGGWTAIGIGLLIGILGWLMDAQLSEAPPTDPRSPVRNDLLASLVIGQGAFLMALILNAFAGLPLAQLGVLLAPGLVICTATGLYFGTGAGRRYLVFLCCSRGRLPWRLGTFLHWAYQAGLLRVSGLAYQFRHQELQDWLHTHPRP
ncbi:NACHT domain-containing protein [Streptomyces albireticuli]|uniref:NACHT domain-containing protein n=1 Tax=Streptomyces albireticuli TaxID=1940 RepID=UPI001472F317|nr:NACHT domain-containing protein [Streptomyces albireticuli]MCD9145455.1 NACHT domain-containing protein [Streptomyces albireticuli]MCD9164980.1 NACHT domain-containing protein [Streptomyces albireticuli]MCD9195429.1 NACHT domain-containing protein [Streptomyces albireticuli]